jgi:hypothetical protein
MKSAVPPPGLRHRFRRVSPKWGKIMRAAITLTGIGFVLFQGCSILANSSHYPGGRRYSTFSNMKQVATAISIYVEDNAGLLPAAANWNDSTWPYARDPDFLTVLPDDQTGSVSGIAYNAALSKAPIERIIEPGKAPMLFTSQISGASPAGGQEILGYSAQGLSIIAAADTSAQRVKQSSAAALDWNPELRDKLYSDPLLQSMSGVRNIRLTLSQGETTVQEIVSLILSSTEETHGRLTIAENWHRMPKETGPRGPGPISSEVHTFAFNPSLAGRSLTDLPRPELTPLVYTAAPLRAGTRDIPVELTYPYAGYAILGMADGSVKTILRSSTIEFDWNPSRAAAPK